MRGVERVHATEPNSTILLAGVGDGLFWSGVYDKPFSLVGAPKTFLTPEAAANLTPFAEHFRGEEYTLPRRTLNSLFSMNQVRVYLVIERKLMHVTAQYKETVSGAGKDQQLAAVQLAEPADASAIGAEWYGPEDGFRWMPKSATVRLSGTGKEIVVSGFCVADQLRDHSQIVVTAAWNNKVLGERSINRCPEDFTLRFPLPPDRLATGILRLTTSSVIRVGHDLRDLGLAVRSVEIR